MNPIETIQISPQIISRNNKSDIPPSHPTQPTKSKFTQRFPNLNTTYYTNLTIQLLNLLYPKFCPHCKTINLSVNVAKRESAVRCPKCHYIGSRTSYTPLHHLKLPLWVFSYLLTESIQMFPQVLSASQIQRRLGVAKNTATLLKRRLQLLCKDLIPAIKALMTDQIKSEFGEEFKFPTDSDIDLTDLVKDKPVVACDTVALFSAKQRSNGHRKRFKHHGQTSSIYLSDAVAIEKGKYQIGTLAHTIGIKGGPVIFNSIPDQKQRTVQPLFDFLPKNSPVFSDEGYPWYKRYNKNHRAVNHSKRAKNKKRNVWGRDRWSCKGVHNQVAEGNQRILKHVFLSGYSYISPKFSQMYLDEYSALKGIKVYGFEKLIEACVGSEQCTCCWG